MGIEPTRQLVTGTLVLKTNVNEAMKVLRGGSGAGVATGQTCSASFKKK